MKLKQKDINRLTANDYTLLSDLNFCTLFDLKQYTEKIIQNKCYIFNKEIQTVVFENITSKKIIAYSIEICTGDGSFEQAYNYKYTYYIHKQILTKKLLLKESL